MTRIPGKSKAAINSMVAPKDQEEVQGWLEAQAALLKIGYLLAHADDGVIWGRVDDGKLVTAPVTAFSPALNGKTLQNARLFNKAGEIYLWRDGDGSFQARDIRDGTDGEGQYFDEAQILWGTHSTSAENGFTLMRDGAQGLRHYVPIKLEAGGNGRPLRLILRHYLKEDSTGFVRVAFSRLVNLSVNSREGN